MISSRRFLSMTVAVLLLAGTRAGAYEVGSYVDEGEPTAAEMAIDVALIRPLGVVALAVGSVFYIAAFPFAAMTGDVATPAERLIADPARYTFDRPLGRIYGPGETGAIHD